MMYDCIKYNNKKTIYQPIKQNQWARKNILKMNSFHLWLEINNQLNCGRILHK